LSLPTTATPFKPSRWAERLAKAIERAKHVTGKEAAEKLARLQEIAEPASGERVRKVVGKVGDEYFLLSTGDISAFQADGDIVWIITQKRRNMATQTLKVLEEHLKNTTFHRIHRSTLVNIDHIQKMSAITSQRWLITLTNDQEFIANKRQAKSVRELLKW
jgi:two-component system, LytTR family, response regulator